MDILSFILGLKKGKNSIKLQEKTVTPSESEIVVVPDASYDALSKVIVEAVQSSGGGSSNILFTMGTIAKNSGASVYVEHGHGKIPDIIGVYSSHSAVPTTGARVLSLVQPSKALCEKIGIATSGKTPSATCLVWNGQLMIGSAVYPDGCIDSASSGGNISYCNATKFKVGGSFYQLDTTTSYEWWAISGLT